MKVKELAELTGTTVRAIRHYHHIGLLPIPDNPGIREYGLEHAVRVVRIRALAASGLSLEAIGKILSSAGTATDELEAAEADIDARIAELQAQRARLRTIRDGSADDAFHVKHVSSLEHFYNTIETLVPPEVLPVIRKERQAAEVLCHIPLVKDTIAWWLEGISDQRLRATADLYTWFHTITDMPTDKAEAAIRDSLEQHRNSLTSEEWGLPPRVWRSLIPSVLRAPGLLPLLFSAYPHPHHQMFIRAFLAEVDANITRHVSRETTEEVYP